MSALGDLDLNCFSDPTKADTSNSIWQGGSPLQFSLSLLIVQLLLYIVISRALHFLLKPLRQPRFVSEIMGGIILGPSVLCRSTAFRTTIFPDRGQLVLDTLSSFGLMFVIFLIGVKMDPSLVIRSGRKSIAIGLLGLAIPFALTFIVSSASADRLPIDPENRFAYLFSFSFSLSITSFAVLVPVLSDLHLLNSELGRIAMSASMTNDLSAWLVITIFVMLQASFVSAIRSMSALLAIVALTAAIIFVVRPIAKWVINQTPAGKPVDESYIFLFLFIVLIIGFLSDIIGTNSFHGALVLGLAIPDGPPLGSALSEKIQWIVSALLLPLYYIVTGLNTDFTAIGSHDNDNGQRRGGGAVLMVFFWCSLGKIVGVLVPSLYYKIPARDALALSLLMSSKGIVDVVTLNQWKNNKLVDAQSYSILILADTVLTAAVTPLATILYQPSRRYAMYKRFTVQHLKPDTELRILACIHDQSHIPATINLLEASSPTLASPVAVYTLHLIELVGRAAPLFIPHKLSRSSSNIPVAQQFHVPIANLPSDVSVESEHIINSFVLYEQRHSGGAASVHPFTTISPYLSMHDEVCRLAVEKRTSFIVLPFHKKRVLNVIQTNSGQRTVNRNVIANAPCSVGVLVDGAAVDGRMGTIYSGEFMHNVCVFFFGGQDDREALAYSSRMAMHPGVTVTVLRFLPSRSIPDDQSERRLDQRLIDEVRMMRAKNKRVVYREALVGDMEEIMQEISSLDESCYNLVMVGMRHRTYSVLSVGLADWCECRELGVIGDFLASTEFESKFSVLVVKQQDQAGLQIGVVDGGCVKDVKSPQ